MYPLSFARRLTELLGVPRMLASASPCDQSTIGWTLALLPSSEICNCIWETALSSAGPGVFSTGYHQTSSGCWFGLRSPLTVEPPTAIFTIETTFEKGVEAARVVVKSERPEFPSGAVIYISPAFDWPSIG